MKRKIFKKTFCGILILVFFLLVAACGKQTQDLIFESSDSYIEYQFRSEKQLKEHFEKHGIDMGFTSAEEYETAASDVINNENALSKTEQEDGDFVFYLEDTNEFVVLSTDGYIRTYFWPDAGKTYFDKQ